MKYLWSIRKLRSLLTTGGPTVSLPLPTTDNISKQFGFRSGLKLSDIFMKGILKYTDDRNVKKTLIMQIVDMNIHAC